MPDLVSFRLACCRSLTKFIPLQLPCHIPFRAHNVHLAKRIEKLLPKILYQVFTCLCCRVLLLVVPPLVSNAQTSFNLASVLEALRIVCVVVLAMSCFAGIPLAAQTAHAGGAVPTPAAGSALHMAWRWTAAATSSSRIMATMRSRRSWRLAAWSRPVRP